MLAISFLLYISAGQIIEIILAGARIDLIAQKHAVAKNSCSILCPGDIDPLSEISQGDFISILNENDLLICCSPSQSYLPLAIPKKDLVAILEMERFLYYELLF